MKNEEIILKAKEKYNKTFYNEIYEQVIKEAIVLARESEREEYKKLNPRFAQEMTALLINMNDFALEEAGRRGFSEAIKKVGDSFCGCNGTTFKIKIEDFKKIKEKALNKKTAYEDEQKLADIEKDCFEKGFSEAIKKIEEKLESDGFLGVNMFIETKDWEELKQRFEKSQNKVSEEINVELWDKEAFKRWNNLNRRQNRKMKRIGEENK